MRVMVIVKANADSEAGKMPDTALLAAMGQFNEELAKAGVMVAGEGLHPSAKGVRVAISDGGHAVTGGPFQPAQDLVAGFWIWQVDSLDDAIEWAKRCPSPHEGGGVLEIRPVFEADDFGDAFTPELREQEDRVRAETARKHPS